MPERTIRPIRDPARLDPNGPGLREQAAFATDSLAARIVPFL
jgi:hypothetical protein